jgi:hypothetical protein
MIKLSQAGMLTLIDSVLQALPIYYMGAQPLPKTVIKQLESFIRRFFLGGNETLSVLSIYSMGSDL